MVREFQLYVVPTPIGNLSDLTLRAIEILKQVDIIACEDTRVTQKLLNHYEIHTKCYSYHKYNEKERVEFFKQLISEGKRVALVSDAGTPVVCDPGNVLITALREDNIEITALPGACAVTTFLSQIPRVDEAFSFVGFMPRSVAQIQAIAKEYLTKDFLFYDSPERILKTLAIIKECRGDIKIALGRELTKLFEEINIGNISEIESRYKDGIKGEIVCLVYRSSETNLDDYRLKIAELKSKGYKSKDIAIILSTLFDVSKNAIYEMVNE